MVFDTIRFLEDYGIQYWTEGKNVSSSGDFINVCCPFHMDSSNHLGIFSGDEETKPFVSCWVCGNHSLYDYLKLMIPDRNPLHIMKEYSTLTSDYYLFQASNKKQKSYFIPEGKELKLPGKEGLTGKYKEYIEGRNYDPEWLVLKYHLREGGNIGAQQYRVVAPVYLQEVAVTYQGRTILPNKYCEEHKIVRYKACDIENELIHHKFILYNIDNCKKNSVIVVEGLPSVWRIGDNCAATFGTGNTPVQAKFLAERYERVYVFFDPEIDAQNKARKLGEALSALGVEVINLRDDSVEDPGEMAESDVINLKRELFLL